MLTVIILIASVYGQYFISFYILIYVYVLQKVPLDLLLFFTDTDIDPYLLLAKEDLASITERIYNRKLYCKKDWHILRRSVIFRFLQSSLLG